MRWIICALAVIGLPASASAQDFNILRGSVPTYHWSGFYVGGQIGETSSEINFGQAASTELSFLLRNSVIEQDEQVSNWAVLPSRTPTSPSFGGFVGYNTEWQNLVLSAELNYNHLTTLSAQSSGTLGRTFTDGTNLPAGHSYYYNVNVAGQAYMNVTDVATLRGRAGWEMGNFLPYAFGGFAVGRANLSSSATLQYSATDYPESEEPPLTPLPGLAYGPVSMSNAQNNSYLYGFTAGLGLDVALTTNVFVRAEFEYIYFAPDAGIQVSLMSGRLGAGLKF